MKYSCFNIKYNVLSYTIHVFTCLIYVLNLVITCFKLSDSMFSIQLLHVSYLVITCCYKEVLEAASSSNEFVSCI